MDYKYKTRFGPALPIILLLWSPPRNIFTSQLYGEVSHRLTHTDIFPNPAFLCFQPIHSFLKHYCDGIFEAFQNHGRKLCTHGQPHPTVLSFLLSFANHWLSVHLCLVFCQILFFLVATATCQDQGRRKRIEWELEFFFPCLPEQSTSCGNSLVHECAENCVSYLGTEVTRSFKLLV